MLGTLIGGLMVAAAPAAAAAPCPVGPERPVLASVAFDVPREGSTLLFSTAPAGHNVRYALKMVWAPGEGKATATLIRLRLRPDCNVVEAQGRWDLDLSSKEAEKAFAAASALQRTAAGAADVALDGATVEVQLYENRRPYFAYRANGAAKEEVSRVLLEIARRHVPGRELPGADWRYRATTKVR
jgi:hypothetical protein